ncbi:MAG: cob(I)yrinic acid a c-diamide adenosyltransferase [Lachnospiraceae bacterium]|nr:cob(I)yrinic acid a c-diamide adenosyltransferase [Lachnospiraceae bacterium]
MCKEKITVYCGNGKGKTAAALGYAIQSASQGSSAIIIQFLKGKKEEELGYLQRLEPEVKFFSFARFEKDFTELSEEEQKEESMNIRNGFNFAKKVLVTGECSILILDSFLELLDYGMITEEDMEVLMKAKSDDTEVMCTGKHVNSILRKYIGKIYEIHAD